MSERLLFLTGHLALPRLERMLAGFGDTARGWRIHDIGVKVAALMTQEIILRRFAAAGRGGESYPAWSLPRRSRGVDEGVRRSIRARAGGNRRSTCLLGRGGNEPDLSRFDMRIFRGDCRRLDDERRASRRARKSALGGRRGCD